MIFKRIELFKLYYGFGEDEAFPAIEFVWSWSI